MKPYEQYKNSGIDWLGQVPSHWEVKKMKYLFSDISIKNKPNETLLSVTQSQGVVPRDWLETRTVLPNGNLETFKFIEKGDFAISLRSFEGGLEYCYYNGIISPAYTVLRKKSNQLSESYYKYLFKSFSFISEMQTAIVGIREGKNISYQELQYSYLPLPPLPEQLAIAKFLDEKTTQIQTAIGIKNEQIAKLKEYRQALINQTVTKGLKADVAMKNSGVEWLGEVPEHWEVKRLKHTLKEKLKYGANESAEFDDRNFPRYIRITDIDENGNLKDETFKSLHPNRASDYLLSDLDILLARSGATVGKSFLYKKHLVGDACYAGYLIKATFNPKIANPYFVNYVLQSGFYNLWIQSVTIQATIQNVSAEKYNEFKIPFPPLPEQLAIVEFLDEKIAQIDKAITHQQNQIERLKEYQQSLVNDVVTGKMRVSNLENNIGVN